MIEESRNTGMMARVILHKEDPGAVHMGAAPLGATLRIPLPDLFCESCDSARTPAYCHLCCEEAMKILGGEKP